MNYKIWLCGVTHQGNEESLRELIEPIKHCFDGLVWTFHYPKDEGAEYLESAKGDGKIIYADWCNRLDYSRNHYLYQGPMKYGDWFFMLDTHERIPLHFAKSLRSLAQSFNSQSIDVVFVRNKRFGARLKPETKFTGNPHEGIQGSTKSIELTRSDGWDDSLFQNVRGTKRDKFHFVKHNLKYYIFPETNHLLLKCENNLKFLKDRYNNRANFLNELYKLNVDPYDFDSIFNYIVEGDFNEVTRDCINREKYLNDVYRLYHMRLDDFEEDFDFENLVKIK